MQRKKTVSKKKARKKPLTTRVSKIENGFRVLLSNKMGHVNIVKTPFGFWETHSWLDPKARNKGFGIKTYSRAIAYCLKHGYTIKSSGSPSDEAIRVWESKRLRAQYRIQKRGSRYHVIGAR